MITYERVKKAAEEKGLKLNNRSFYIPTFIRNEPCGCVLTCLSPFSTEELEKLSHTDTYAVGERVKLWASDTYGAMFSTGLMNGFDGFRNPVLLGDEDYNRGNKLGMELLKELENDER